MRPLAAALLCLLLLGAAARAKESVVGMSERVFEILAEVQVLIDAEDTLPAREQLDELMGRRGLSSYERAHALNLIAYTWYLDDDLQRAIAAYEEALALPELPESMRVTLLLSLGQLHLAAGSHVDAEGYLRRLLAMERQDTPNNQMLLASALMGQGRFAAALEPMLAAIAAETEAGGKPREQWLAMLASAHYELNDYEAMRAVVAQLATLYPREQYLMNLAALHGQLGEPGRQLALVEALLDDRRLEKGTHLKLLANLYLARELPYEAAALLQRGLDSGRIETDRANLELLSQAWYMAAEVERAIEPLSRAAALAEDGELFMRLARLHMDSENWEAADRAARAALEKEGLREEGHAWLLRGMAQVRLEKFTAAEDMFQRAARFRHSRQYASQWLDYVESEQQRVRLAAAGADG